MGLGNSRYCLFLLLMTGVILFNQVSVRAQQAQEWKGVTEQGEPLTREELTLLLDSHQKWQQRFSGLEGIRSNIESITNNPRISLEIFPRFDTQEGWSEKERLNLAGADLKSVILEKVNLSFADLSNANLSKANLKNSINFMTDFNTGELMEADLTNSEFTRSIMTQANLFKANLSGSTMNRVDLKFSNLTGANLSGVILKYSDLKRANLVLADLSKADLSQVDLRGADLTGANLSEAKLTESNLSGAILIGANLTGAIISNSNLSGTDLSSAKLIRTEITDTKMENAILVSADLTSAVLENVYLQGADLSGADLADTVFEVNLESLPTIKGISEAVNLSSLKFKNSPAVLKAISAELKSKGYIPEERLIQIALARSKRELAWETGDLVLQVEFILNKMLFEITSDYGQSPGKAVLIIIISILLFSLVYARILTKEIAGTGIQRVYGVEENSDQGRPPEPVTFDPSRKNILPAFLTGLYISFMFSLRLGFKDQTISNWITRMQPNDYVFKATGWARLCAGVQTAFSYYILSPWLLTYFEIPFE